MSFERQLGELLDFGDVETPPPDPARIIRGARRRRARRTVGAVVATACVAVAATVAVHLTGPTGPQSVPMVGAVPVGTASARPATPAPDPTVAPGPSRVVAPGERIGVHPDLMLWVTASEVCAAAPALGSPPGTPVGTECQAGPAPGSGRPGLHYRGAGSEGGPLLITGAYTGPTVPSRIVVTEHGHETVATIVTAAGMTGWTAYYAVVPFGSGGDPGAPLESAIVAYDAAGGVLARSAPSG